MPIRASQGWRSSVARGTRVRANIHGTSPQPISISRRWPASPSPRSSTRVMRNAAPALSRIRCVSRPGVRSQERSAALPS